MATNNFGMPMKIFLLATIALFIFSSCQKTYEYVEFRDNGEIVKEELKSNNDSIAYFEAYTKFEISKYASKNLAKLTKNKPLDTPTSFQVFINNEPLIANFINQKENELSITKKIASQNTNTEIDSTVQIDSIKLKKLLTRFNIKTDEFSNDRLTYIQHKSVPKDKNSTSVHVYYTVKDKEPNSFRIVIQYASGGWFFFKKAQFSVDNMVFSYVPSETHTDSKMIKICQWSDEPIINQNDIELIKALASAKKAKVKLISKNDEKVVEISKKELTAIKETLELYNLSGANL